MAADQAFNQASMEVQAQITQNAQALQKYGIEAGLAQQYAQMWEDKTYKAQVLALQESGMDFTRALQTAAAQFDYGWNPTTGTFSGQGYQDRSLTNTIQGRTVGQGLDTIQVLTNLLYQMEPGSQEYKDLLAYMMNIGTKTA
jgi:3-isopropylmalate dehydratase small subunit